MTTGARPGIKPGLLRARRAPLPPRTLKERFSAWVRSVCARNLKFGLGK